MGFLAEKKYVLIGSLSRSRSCSSGVPDPWACCRMRPSVPNPRSQMKICVKRSPGQDQRKMATKIRARVQKSKRAYVHNDLSQAAQHHEDAIQEKLNNGKRHGIAYDGMACALLVAFAFEANLNFIGHKLLEAGKLPNWQEREKFDKKLKKVFSALGIPIEEENRPLSSMTR